MKYLLISSIVITFSIYLAIGQDELSSSQLEYSKATSSNDEDLLEAASSENVQLSANSHKIVASGWPSTSPMWPSIDQQQAGQQQNGTNLVAEPFIYADKPRTIDYSLLLTLNDTFLNKIKSLNNKPMAINLSFDYYFNHEPKITALPGIKIEVDRKQYKYLEPNQQTIRTKLWIKFNEQIAIMDGQQQLNNHDWLKFSLVNRQAQSLVAIRHLRVEFIGANPGAPPIPPANELAPTNDPRQTSIVPPPVGFAPTTPVQSPPPINQQPPEQQGPPEQILPPQGQLPPLPQQQQYPPAEAGNEQVPAASNILEDRIKPVGPPDKKKSSWSIWGKRRRKRQAPAPSEPQPIVLTCYQSDQCENWRTEDGQLAIQWSLARMPPSTNTVQSGYYYVSNRQNYGDASKLLRLSLNQTDSATIADQNSDHCLELALYVTEQTHLKLYRLTRLFIDNVETYAKGNLLISWAPTVTTEFSNVALTQSKVRGSLPNSRLLAMESNQSGWTLETVCFGDFFSNIKDCGAGNCYLGFEMENDANKQHAAMPLADPSSSIDGLQLDQKLIPEQVVGVALLKEFTLNVPLKQPRVKQWLETWQREEIEPGDNWKFYPRLDFQVDQNNISLLNMYHNAHYYIESDWLNVDNNLDLTGTLAVELSNFNETIFSDNKNSTLYQSLLESAGSVVDTNGQQSSEPIVFQLKIETKLVDSNYDPIYTNNSTIDWPLKQNNTLYSLGLPVTEHIKANRHNQLKKDSNDDGLFKIVFEFILNLTSLTSNQLLNQFIANNFTGYKLSLVNISVSDRCFPNPCQFGGCQQNGTGYDDWNCHCDDKHRGRRCEFGRWCNIPHVTPWVVPTAKDKGVVLKAGGSADKQQQLQTGRQAKLNVESITRVTGRDYCQRKLGPGFKCTDIDLPLNDNLYTEEDKTFYCSCQDDFYLSDDSKCKQAHLCNSVLCPAIGMICDDTKPFNRTQPCHCNEKQDWFPEVSINSQLNHVTKCVRNQCHDIKRDCGFDAHICLPTLPGERPICKCGPKFSLKTNEKGEKFCDSTACVLPTLNNCDQICEKDNTNLQRAFKCACHPGYSLNQDGHTCSQAAKPKLSCKPACPSETQICTEFGCKCKPGFVGEGEVIVSQHPTNKKLNQNGQPISYVQSVRCLNVCSLTYAENKAEFEMVESVCPLGLCDPATFQCRCSDPSSSALINTKYEPIYANSTDSDDSEKKRISPLCHLRRVCEPDSSSYKICRSQGAICVPDYTKAAMFDCICPPSTEKKFYGQGTSSEFTCELRCSAKKYDCLRRQAVCKLIDKDQVRCDCLPGLMFDEHDKKCYLAKYSYAFNLIIVNRYYEPESKFHKLLNGTTIATQSNTAHDNNDQTTPTTKLYENESNPEQTSSLGDIQSSEIVPQKLALSTAQFQVQPRSIFITDYNQCNITQVISKSVIEDQYEHDIESYLSYIDQCNEKIHQNVRTYHLNSKLSEDLRQSLRQHLREFTVTTNNGSCFETDQSGIYLNCTVYLQSNEPILESTINYVFNDCDKNGYQNDKYCWVKPKLLLKLERHQLQPSTSPATASGSSNSTSLQSQNQNQLLFRQIIPCEIDNFCGLDAYSYRLDDKTSLCSCKCPLDIEVVDVKDLEARRSTSLHQLSDLEVDPSKVSVKEICAPKNHCGANSTFCLGKTGSACQYDIRTGSRCTCVYPSYEDAFGKCVEVTFSQFDNTLIVIIILLGTGLIVSMAINLTAVLRSKSLFGRSKQYPLNEFPSSSRGRAGNHNNSRSTGIPNPAFTND